MQEDELRARLDALELRLMNMEDSLQGIALRSYFIFICVLVFGLERQGFFGWVSEVTGWGG